MTRFAADGFSIGGASALRIFGKIRHNFKPALFPAPGKADAAGKQHRLRSFVPGAVLVVAHQGVPPGGKLHPYLVAPSGVETNPDETAFPGGKAGA